MKEIILGKEGNQCFSITNDSVSRQHAKITIDDDGHWLLKDMNSTNGTFIQDEKGEFVQVNRVEIDEFTRIALGSTTATGFFFYAHHVLEPKGYYDVEMRHVIDLNNKMMKEKEKLDASNNWQNIVIRFLPPVASSLFLLLVSQMFPHIAWLQKLSGFATAVLLGVSGLLQHTNGRKVQDWTNKKAKLIRCPKCNRQLSPADLANEQCAGCKVHT